MRINLPEELRSYQKLAEAFLFCMVMIFLPFTQISGQATPKLPHEAEQHQLIFGDHPNNNHNSPIVNIYMEDGIPVYEDGSLVEKNSDAYNLYMKDYVQQKTPFIAKNNVVPLPNPELSPNMSCTDLRVVFVLDESGSILVRNAVDQVREAVLGLAESLQGSYATLKIVEFNSLARVIDLDETNVNDNYIANLNDYLYNEYNGESYNPVLRDPADECPQNFTNWQDAFEKVHTPDEMVPPSLVIFLTDGEPTAKNVDNNCGFQASGGLDEAIIAANALKANGVHVFAMGVGDYIDVPNLQLISGTSSFGTNGSIFTDDYSTGSFDELKDNLKAGLIAICGTELGLSKTVDLDQVCSDDQTLTFTIIVENLGGANNLEAKNVIVEDEFPTAFTSLNLVAPVPAGASIDGQKLTYEVGHLLAGESRTIQVQAMITGAPGIYDNIAIADASNTNKVEDSVSIEKSSGFSSSESIIACESFTLNPADYVLNPVDPDEEVLLASSTSYVRTITGETELGCAKTVTLNIIVNERISTDPLVAASCGAYEWDVNGDGIFDSETEPTLIESGIYYEELSNKDGLCELATLELTITPAIEFRGIRTSCSGPVVLTIDDGYGNDFPIASYSTSGQKYSEIDLGSVCVLIDIYVNIGQPGDACNDGDPLTINDTITENCECEGTPVEEFDCPELSLNIGDNCDDGDDTTENDQVGEDCTCAGTPIPPVYECPEFEANIGDACTDSEGRSGTLTNDCDCYVPFECTADAGSVFFNDGTTEKTFCADDGIPSTFEFLFLPGNLSDSTAAIITDAAGYGLFMTRDIAEGEAFDFDLLGIGTWHVYIATYNGGHSNGNHLIFDLFLNGIPVNISDLDGCFDISNQLTLIGESCQPVYECPEFEANIGDACTDSEGKSGTLTDDCDCYVPFECTADAGSVAFSDGSFEKTFCADDDIASTFEFLYIPGNLTDSTAAIITDDSGLAYAMIRDVAVGEAFDFDQLGIGTWHIYIASYNGDHSNGNHLVFDLFLNGLPVYVSDLEGCYDLSDPLTLIGESCVPEVDCEDLGLNIGDPCDDGDDTTENDQVGEDCICAGTPVPPVYDCEEYQANIGDDCWENDQKGVLDENCDCVGGGTPVTDCNEFAYFITNNKPGQSATIYGITLTGGVAEMHFIADYPEELHLAYNQEEKLLYGISKMSTMYVTMDPYAAVPAFGPQVTLNEAPGEVTGAVFSPQGELLISSQTKKAIFIVDLVTNDLIQYDDYAPVFGGDMAYSADGTLYLVTNTGGALYEVVPEGVGNDVLIVNTDTKKNTGMAITANDQLLISVHGHSALTLLNTDGTSAGSIPLMLNGESFVLDYGDMASGCSSYKDPDDNTCSNFATFYTHYNEVTEESDIYSVEFDGSSANLTHLLPLPFEVHIGYDGENDLLYMVSKTGSFFRVYDVGADLVLGDVPFSTTLNDVTAVEFSVHDKQLYIGHQRFKNIYKVDPANGQVQLHGTAPIYGGDIAIFNNGNAYLSSQTGQMLYNISDINNPVGVGSIPIKVSGMTLMGENLVTSNYGSDVFYEISTADASVQNTYTALFNGEPFEVGFGDMAGGCRSIENDKILGLKTAAQNEAAQATLTAFPNPTEGESKVVFQTTENTKALVEVYDMNGRVVATLFDQDANAGQSYTLDFNGNKLPNGIYVYRLTTQNETIIEKFMIAR